MAIDQAPIQDSIIDSNARVTWPWIAWFELVSRRVSSVLWFDDNDTATTSSPIVHTGGATNTYLTNDGLGANTNQYNPNGIPRIWDATNNQFDFSNLQIGDTVFFRFDFYVETSTNNQEMDFYLDMSIGSNPYTLQTHHRHDKFSGVKHVTFVYEIYIGNADTLNNPAKIRFESADNAEITVNGWYTRIHRS